MAMILDSETVDNLTDNDHYQNLLKILNWDGYNRWDEYQGEKLYYLSMYKKYVIDKAMHQRYPGGLRFPTNSDFDTFCQEVL